MTRYGLRDDQWEQIKDMLLGKPGDVGATVTIVEAVLFGRLEEYAPAVQPLGQGRRMGACLSTPGSRWR
jgi:hypothetical protein